MRDDNVIPFADLPPWRLVTDSGKPDEHFIREAALALLARDTLLGHDSATAENALAHARYAMDEYEDAAHDGDCTNQPMTCWRCLMDEAKREARELHDD